jgi:hydroxymethylpyrimidine/phosphomethylpyrimidine kinase
MRLLRGVTQARDERVACRAVEIGALNYKSIASILAHNLDRRPPTAVGDAVIVHANIRGPRYFH